MSIIPVIFDTKNDNLIASFEWNSSHQTGTRASKPAIYCQADECNPGRRYSRHSGARARANL
jgi:hypothetical protein